ncbi:MAG TPA: asparagine synthetase B, partial [Planctomycetes bacterium]|nr:asparagine synthetase B [Planctomycetota bacterium]
MLIAACLYVTAAAVHADRLLVPMDLQQRNHLKAYGLAFWVLERNIEVDWLLNY